MARGFRQKIELTPDERRITEKFGIKLAAELKEQIFEVDGTPTLTVKYPDKTFKKKPVTGIGLFFTGLYLGAKGTPIFVFAPEDAQEWEQVEFEAKQLDEVIPLFGGAVARSLGVTGEAVGEVFKRAVIHELQAEQAAKKVDADKSVSGLQSNPNFGLF